MDETTIVQRLHSLHDATCQVHDLCYVMTRNPLRGYVLMRAHVASLQDEDVHEFFKAPRVAVEVWPMVRVGAGVNPFQP